jgi:hypothetical protein
MKSLGILSTRIQVDVTIKKLKPLNAITDDICVKKISFNNENERIYLDITIKKFKPLNVITSDVIYQFT